MNRSWLFAAITAARPHQWAKNLLIFVPLILGQQFDRTAILHAIVAFGAFSACASAVYIVNDILDVTNDRQHPRKRLRPFAAGALTAGFGMSVALGLLLVAFLLAVQINAQSVAILVVYLFANVLYGAWLKSKPVIDVLFLSGMYGLRLEMGSAATTVPLSPWLLAFALFFFTSLAFAKRYVELRVLDAHGHESAGGRGYRASDASLLASLGPTSGYVAVLVLALYMNSDQMHALYGEGRVLWLLCPLVLYWITRVWLLAKRGELDDDPVVFALKDKPSLMVAGLAALVIVAATCIARYAA